MLNILRGGISIPGADTVKNNIMSTYNKNKKKIQQFLQVIVLKNFI